MTDEISRWGKEHLETARSLPRAAETMTDSLIAGQLRALAEDYERRAERGSFEGSAKASGSSLTSAGHKCA
jgi:hypothetical protein